MKVKSCKKTAILCISAAMCAALAGAAASALPAYAAEDVQYNGLYRNQLAYSAAKGWNNDPNGLLYIDDTDDGVDNGTYHMYYQYNLNEQELGWGHMSWGHATSTDLVHWTQQPVAIPEGQQGYGMMFSGSAVYDKDNTSGLFEESGIIAILTQPDDNAGGQRQVLAYSEGTEGKSFTIYGEILGAHADGDQGDGEFRDPKVFRVPEMGEDKDNDGQPGGKWVMAVGGGSVRMYSSDNLIDWTYLGETGFWGECPDFSRFTVNGQTKYVLIVSPEDKQKSHDYNATQRFDTYYPAEYYVVGHFDEGAEGLFVAETPLTRLSQGIDSYAWQSFNDAPDGKVYGISWSASWKTVSDYQSLRENHNGGMTVACELQLTQENGGYVLTRYPVSAIEGLRSAEPVYSYDGVIEEGENALGDTRATVADFEIELDFTDGTADSAEICLRKSDAERLVLTYDSLSGLLTLDRSQSSLAAASTTLFGVDYSQVVPLENGKLTLRILLDRAFVSVFANGGRASCFSAFFPAISSDGMSLTADGTLGVSAKVYGMSGIFGGQTANNKLYVSTNKIDSTVGEVVPVSASMLSEGFTNASAVYTVTEGAENISLESRGDATYITMLKKGSARIAVTADGASASQIIEVYIYGDGLKSDVDYTVQWGGFRRPDDNGLWFSSGQADSFLYCEEQTENFAYSVTMTPANGNAQAAALVVGASPNHTDYYVVTADFSQNVIKLWRSGVGDIKTAPYAFGGARALTLRAVVSDGVLSVYADKSDKPSLTYTFSEYEGGLVGLNVYNGEFIFNDIHFSDLSVRDNSMRIGSVGIESILNVTDRNAILSDGDYSVQDGVLTLSQDYLLSLCGGKQYTLKINTVDGALYMPVTSSAQPLSATSAEQSYDADGEAAITLGSSDVTVTSVMVDDKIVNFTQQGNTVTIAAGQLSALGNGNYAVEIYTSSGRAECTIVLTGETLPELPQEPVTPVISLTVDGQSVADGDNLAFELGAKVNYRVSVQGGTISGGTLVHPEDGNIALTSTEGELTFDAAGEYRIIITADGAEDFEVTITVTAPAEPEVPDQPEQPQTPPAETAPEDGGEGGNGGCGGNAGSAAGIAAGVLVLGGACLLLRKRRS